MDQTDIEKNKIPGPDGNEANSQRRPSIELKKLDSTEASNDQKYSSNTEDIYKAKEPGTWMICLKFSLILLIIFIWILGAAITGIGIWMAVDKEFWTLQLNLDIKMFSTGIYVGIAVGVVILIIGIIACLGVWKQSTCLLITFAVIIVVLVLLEATSMGIIWATSNNPDLQEHLIEYIKRGINRRHEDDSIRYFVDLLQSKLRCCGVENDEEFGEKDRYPESCKDPRTGVAFDEGCLTAVIRFLKHEAGIIGGVAASVLTLELAALSFTVCLLCGLRQAKKNIF